MKPFLSGRAESPTKALASAKMRPGEREPGMVRHSHVPDAVPVVETVKEGDKVVRLIVKCTCGERIEIECLYSA